MAAQILSPAISCSRAMAKITSAKAFYAMADVLYKFNLLVVIVPLLLLLY
jgi:hypothetical protein